MFFSPPNGGGGGGGGGSNYYTHKKQLNRLNKLWPGLYWQDWKVCAWHITYNCTFIPVSCHFSAHFLQFFFGLSVQKMTIEIDTPPGAICKLSSLEHTVLVSSTYRSMVALHTIYKTCKMKYTNQNRIHKCLCIGFWMIIHKCKIDYTTPNMQNQTYKHKTIYTNQIHKRLCVGLILHNTQIRN